MYAHAYDPRTKNLRAIGRNGRIGYGRRARYASFSFFNVIIGSLNQSQKYIFYIFTNITCFSKSSCISNSKRNIKQCS